MSTMRRAHTRILGCLVVVGLLSVVPAAADVVTSWNTIATTVVGAGNRPGPSGVLDVATVHLAMHDAIQAFQHRFEPYAADVPGASGSPIVAAARAARDVLVNRFPAQAGSIETSYQNYLTANGLLPTDPGALVGQQAAANTIAARANDGSFPSNPEVFTGSTAPGQWRPTPPALAPMAAPWLGSVVPFALKNVEGVLHEPPPPDLGSGAYTKAYDEVKALGARSNSSRTPEQTDLGLFYSENFLLQLNRVLHQLTAAHLVDIGDSARLFALAHVAGADAIISSWANKRHYNIWRPSTAIFEGDNDGNPRTDGDTSWLPLINDPPYPDYTSGANSVTNGFMRTLALYFGDDAFPFTVTSNAAGVTQRTRAYERFSDVAADVVEARIYLGIHFRFADVVARQQGKQAADWAFSHVLRPID
jgi:hypothetical protein